jgi:hypothetical protein
MGSNGESKLVKAGRAVGAFLDAVAEKKQEEKGDSLEPDVLEETEPRQKGVKTHQERVEKRRRSDLPEHRRENIDRQTPGKRRTELDNSDDLENLEEWIDEI